MSLVISEAGAGLDVDLLDPAVVADPYGTLGPVRDACPVLWSARHRLWLVSGYDAARDVLRRHEDAGRATGAARPRGGRPLRAMQWVQAQWFLQMDPPEHTPLRRFFGSYFTAGKIAWTERVAEECAEELVAGLDADRLATGVEFVEEVAVPLPSAVLSRLLGTARAEADLYRRWSAALLRVQELDRGPEDIARADEVARESQEFFGELIAARRREPRDDIVSYAVAERDESAVPDDVLAANLLLILAAGEDTTVSLLANGMLALARNPQQWAALAADPALAGPLVEEVLRYDGPAMVTGRVARRDFSLAGTPIAVGDSIAVFIGLASRDPRRFAEPAEFRIARSPNGTSALASACTCAWVRR